ncbi:hypothetical protein [Holdemania massiliensis]|uniref:hypothetical protein n=1 Tax=Holdemania massiliensis TaxID=1468449 RepID=UPI0026756259|nr:hypothetical protein [Holdemania massiliensis]
MGRCIDSKQKLKFYLNADMIMNRGVQLTAIEHIKSLIKRDYIMIYLRALRKVEYYKGKSKFMYLLYRIQFSKHGIKLGFSIEPNVFEYGLVIPHHGTIVVGGGNAIGSYCVLHTCVCITNGQKNIGNGLYCSTGVKILNDITIGNNVSIGANAVITKPIEDDVLVIGIPGSVVRKASPWYIHDGGEFQRRFALCEKLKAELIGA